MQILQNRRRSRHFGLALGLGTALSWLPLSQAADPPAWLTSEIDPLEQTAATVQGNSSSVVNAAAGEVRDGFAPQTAPQFAEDASPTGPEFQQTSFLDNGFTEYLAETSDLTLSTREVSPSRGLWRMPDFMGTLLRLGPQHDVTFRPIATIPTPSTGTVVLDAASNRFVYIDGASETLVPGAPSLGTDFVTFVATGGGDINATAGVLPDGTRGYFGLTRITQDAGSGMTTQSLPGFDLLSQTPPGSMTITTVGVTNPISTVNYNAEPHTAHFSVTGPSPTNPSFATVGVNRQADGGSVIPRNRVFFHYSYFDSVALGQGIDLHRFTPGFETTLAHGLMSLEARFPIAATLDASPVLNGTVSSNEIEFGNVSLHLKSVLAGVTAWWCSVNAAGQQCSEDAAGSFDQDAGDAGQSCFPQCSCQLCVRCLVRDEVVRRQFVRQPELAFRRCQRELPPQDRTNNFAGTGLREDGVGRVSFENHAAIDIQNLVDSAGDFDQQVGQLSASEGPLAEFGDGCLLPGSRGDLSFRSTSLSQVVSDHGDKLLVLRFKRTERHGQRNCLAAA